MINSIALTCDSRKEGLLNLRTNKYKLHFYETATGLKFVMNTDINDAASSPNVTALLHGIYQSVSVPVHSLGGNCFDKYVDNWQQQFAALSIL